MILGQFLVRARGESTATVQSGYSADCMGSAEKIDSVNFPRALSRWAAAGVQYWPGRQPIEEAPVAWGPHGPLAIGTIERASLEDDGIPW
jgi:hypothetical protein